jgi:hypothetical protein
MRGYRSPGFRKQKLIKRLFGYIQRAGICGIKVEYLLKNYLGVKDFNKIPTKRVSGLISECRQFLYDNTKPYYPPKESK